MDIFSVDRFKLLDQMEDILKLARQEHENLENGQTDMFGVQEFSLQEKKELDEVYNSNETSKLEFESLGYHLQHHPVDENLWELEQISPVKIKDLAEQMINLSGLQIKNKENPNGDIEIIYTGLRPGEKLYEELLIDAECLKTSHPLIFRANENFIFMNKLLPELEELKVHLSNRNKKQSFKVYF